MDDVYPGWDGLAPTPALLHDQVLEPLARGERAAYRRLDWVRPTGRRGARGAAGAAARRRGLRGRGVARVRLRVGAVWVEASREVRFARAIDRDGEAYRPHWERWAA